MHAALLFLHLAAGSIWVGGHLVLAVSLLPEAVSKRDPGLIRGFERIYERVGLPALVIQVATGLWLAHQLRPGLASWMAWDDPVAQTIALKLACLAATVALAAHARLAIIPRLDAARLPMLGIHIVAVTGLALAFVWLGVAFRYGGV
ncbi:MAG: CopD family protein [Rhodospirillaceae bacterium]|jgi:putative copper export protein|nr:CopD family protein [Rhodospirillaceae bacterium]